MVAFAPSNGQSAEETLTTLAGLLKRRLRSTDEIGWVDDRRIGALLPSTPAFGASKVAEDVVSIFPQSLAPPVWQIYCYPSDDPPSKVPWEIGASEPGVFPDQASVDPVRPLEAFFLAPMPVWKRCMDVVGSSLGLVLLSPLFLLVAAGVKVTSPGPVFFKHMRSGRGGKPFVIYKFRSMLDGAEKHRDGLKRLNEQDGPAFKIKADPRVTPLGRFLRKTSIDELPQLWNVLRGEMSLVGPRPLPCDESDACEGWHRRRLEATPGLTCIWQVSGRSKVSFNEWARMDIRYRQKRTLWHDIRLLARTVLVVFRGNAW
jgi:lipopolysaccharide/colanic/teichoic acid biosynthesis glycosyltransferase